MRQSRPDSCFGCDAKVLETFEVVWSSLGIEKKRIPGSEYLQLFSLRSELAQAEMKDVLQLP
jgi:hypothetical protein